MDYKQMAIDLAREQFAPSITGEDVRLAVLEVVAGHIPHLEHYHRIALLLNSKAKLPIATLRTVIEQYITILDAYRENELDEEMERALDEAERQLRATIPKVSL